MISSYFEMKIELITVASQRQLIFSDIFIRLFLHDSLLSLFSGDTYTPFGIETKCSILKIDTESPRVLQTLAATNYGLATWAAACQTPVLETISTIGQKRTQDAAFDVL